MDPRPPHRPGAPAGRGPIAMGGRPAFAALVQERMHGGREPNPRPADPLWTLITRDGRWICPFCTNAVARRPQRTLEDSAALHLEGCRAFERGKGRPKGQAEAAERQAFEDLVVLAGEDPGRWAAFDMDGVWWCPACLCRQPGVRHRGRIDALVMQGAWRHLRTCPPYLAGTVHDAAGLQAARDGAQRSTRLRLWATRHLLFEAWRYCLPDGTWLCPCCLTGVPGVRLAPDPAWAAAPAGIADHLAACPRFSLEQPPAIREEDLRRIAGSPPMPYPGNTPTQVGVITARLALPPGSTPPGGSPRIQPLAGAGSATTVAAPWDDAPPSAVDTTDATRDLTWMDDLDLAAPASEARRPGDSGEFHRAKRLQAHMLGVLPDLPGFRFAASYEACSGISGDFYTCIPLPNGDYGLAMGDVSGHGMGAGLVMSMAKKSLEIFARQGGAATPSDLLAQVNDALIDDLAGKLFISMVYGVLSPERGTITWARAGHLPVLCCHPGAGTVTEIKPRGMVLGMKGGSAFRQSLEDEVVRLVPGSMFLLYTDGIIEAANRQGEEFGSERLAEVVRRCSDDPEHLVDQIMHRLHHFQGPGPANDDVTLLAMQVRP